MPHKATFVLFILLVACGTSGSPPSTTTTTTTTSVEQAESLVCEQLQIVRDLANEVSLMTPIANTAPTEGGDIDAAGIAAMHAIASFLDEQTPTILAAYEAAAVAAENFAALAADIREVKEATAVMNPIYVETMSTITSFSDFDAMGSLLSDPVVAQQVLLAMQATLRIDEFTIPTCGFKLSS